MVKWLKILLYKPTLVRLGIRSVENLRHCKLHCNAIVSRGVYSIKAWTQPASLKKRGGNENHAYFRENWGGEIKGEVTINYLSTYLHCLPLIFSKIFSLATLARLHLFVIPQSGDAENIRQGRNVRSPSHF